jgi:hypothetical protein
LLPLLAAQRLEERCSGRPLRFVALHAPHFTLSPKKMAHSTGPISVLHHEKEFAEGNTNAPYLIFA